MNATYTPPDAPPADSKMSPDKGRHKNVIRRARNALLLTACLVFISEMISTFRNGGIHPVVLLIVAFGVGKFLLLALWTRKKPFHALLLGLITFLSINLFAAMVYTFEEKIGPYAGLRLLADGIVLKIIILLTLVIALSRRKELQQTQRLLTAREIVF